MLIDTHAHLNFSAYKDDSNEVIKRCQDNNIWVINVGSQYSTSERAVEIAERYQEGMYAAVGLHPIHALEEEFEYEKYKKLAQSPKILAIGEIGLDYKLEYVLSKEKQKTVFFRQLDLAKELNLPVIFHCRMAHDDLIEILESKITNNKLGLRGVIHCFTGNWEQAKKYLDMGLYLGFNGIVFRMDLDEVIEKTPLEQMVVETDCPYLTPKPMEGRNEPLYVKYVIEKIAKIKNLNQEEIAKITTENAKKLFKI